MNGLSGVFSTPFTLADLGCSPIHTNLHGVTTDGTAGIGCVPRYMRIADIFHQCQKCSMHVHKDMPNGRFDAAPNRIWDNGCEGVCRPPVYPVGSLRGDDLRE